MICVKDNFLDKGSYDKIKENLSSNEFIEVDLGGDSFYVQPCEDQSIFWGLLEQMENRRLRNIISFYRTSTDKLDTDWRIHSDLNIMNERPERAAVLYLSPRPEYFNGLAGTAFWKHEKYGIELPPEVTDEEFDRMLTESGNDMDQWTLESIVGHRENRIVTYPCAYFHSKFPKQSWESGRNILVSFYSGVAA